jgi:hypothetical protein
MFYLYQQMIIVTEEWARKSDSGNYTLLVEHHYIIDLKKWQSHVTSQTQEWVIVLCACNEGDLNTDEQKKWLP